MVLGWPVTGWGNSSGCHTLPAPGLREVSLSTVETLPDWAQILWSPSTEELLATLQGQVQSLTMQNKELREKIQILENYERDESNLATSGDFVPVSLYDSLKCELKQLKEQHAEAQAALKALEGGRLNGKAVLAEAHEQLKAEYEGQIRALQEALRKGSVPGEVTPARDQAAGPAEASGAVGERSTVEQLTEELAQTRGKYEAALAEVQMLREQMQLGILSVVEPTEGAGTELAVAKAALQQAQEALEEREQRVRELQSRLEAREAAGGPRARSEAEETTASLGASLEEASREKAALLERCGRAEAAAEALRRSLEAKTRDWQAVGGPELEARALEQRLAELTRQHGEVTAQLGRLREALGHKEAELDALREQLAARPVARQEHEEALARLRQALAEAEGRVAQDKHAARLEAELVRAREAAVPRGEHEAVQAGLQAEAAALAQRLSELARRHEKTCEEVFRVQLTGPLSPQVSSPWHWAALLGHPDMKWLWVVAFVTPACTAPCNGTAGGAGDGGTGS
uniref:Uncharacterized protein n=1 Tax=Apteryx owenii TaxID=8824 RepID=A0A8B9SBM5_APTOW